METFIYDPASHLRNPSSTFGFGGEKNNKLDFPLSSRLLPWTEASEIYFESEKVEMEMKVLNKFILTYNSGNGSVEIEMKVSWK